MILPYWLKPWFKSYAIPVDSVNIHLEVSNMKYFSISEASDKLNIPDSTLRFYEKKGLLPMIERDDAGRRLFSEDQMALLETLVCLKNTHMLLVKLSNIWTGS